MTWPHTFGPRPNVAKPKSTPNIFAEPTTGHPRGWPNGYGLAAPTSHAIMSVTHPDGTHDYFAYDTAGRLVRTERDGGVKRVTFGHDALSGDNPGRVVVTEATGRQTTLYFGLGGQLAQ